MILVSSGASSTGYQAWGLYSMAKAGMNSLARTVASEERENGVAIFSVRPGMVNVSNVLCCWLHYANFFGRLMYVASGLIAAPSY